MKNAEIYIKKNIDHDSTANSSQLNNLRACESDAWRCSDRCIHENPNVTPEQMEKIREKLGLNDPWYVQYGHWIGKAVQGDFGHVIYT